MASSRSNKRGQTPATCNLCEEETRIRWKCLNCDMMMCTKCKEKIHVKFKFAKDHNVIDIKDVGDHHKVLDFSDLKCEEHTEQSAVMFCTSCDRLVCTSCISKFHNGHGFVEIAEGYNIKVEKFKNDHIKVKKNIDEFTQKIQDTSHGHKTKNAHYKELIKKIEDRETELQNAVEKFVKELKGDLKREWRKLRKGEIIKAEKALNDLQELSSNADNVIRSKDAEKLFTECKKMSRAASLADLDLGTLSFLPGQISPYNVGSLQVVFAVDIRFVGQFQTDITRILYVTLCADDSLWITDQDVLQKVKQFEHKLEVESTFNINVFCMAITPTGDLLLSSSGSVLKQISGATELTESIYNVHPLFYCEVHVTKHGKVIVGVKSGGEPFPVMGRRALIVMNEKGEHETKYEHDKNNTRIFALPMSITSTDNENICVVDRLSDDHRGRVVVLNKEGDILHIYTGHPDTNREKNLFRPMHVVTTPSDNFIVTDLGSNIFHILNNCGHLITHYNVGDMGIIMPYSLCFARNVGQLYIGCTRAVGSSEKAKLYEVHFSGC